MVYISEVTKKDDFLSEKQNNYPNKLKSLIYFFKLKLKKINHKFLENNEIIYIGDRAKGKLIQYLISKNVKVVCLSDYLLEKEDITKLLIENGIKILDGRWLLSYSISKIIEYILSMQNKKVSAEEIAILTNNTDDVIIDTIYELAKKAKAIHIITENRSKFTNIENKLYEEYGIVVNISNNYRKSLSKINTIINFNLSEKEINKYTIPKFAVVVNMKEKIKICSKIFEGLNINHYQIFMPKNYIKYIKYFPNFDQTILYESFIYRKDTYSNIIKKIENDNVRICTLVGDNGNIKKFEYGRLNKNKFDNERIWVKNANKVKII